MRRLQYTILILCFLCPQWIRAQRRFMTSERWEYRLEQLSEFTTKDVSSQTDIFWGLHKSQYVGTHHLFGFSVEGSFSGFVNNMPNAAFRPGGGAAGFHLLYEYQYSGFLLQTGVGINYQNLSNAVRDTTIYHYNMHDTWQGINDVPFTLRHDFTGRVDQAQHLYAQIPLYVGHYIVGSYGVGYWLAGLHANYAVWGNTRQNLTGTTRGLYEKYLGIWHEMDNHGFRQDVPIERTGNKLNLKLDIMAHGEIGYEYTTYHGPHNYRKTAFSNTDIRFRFAAFADFGILNIMPSTNGVLYGTPMESIYDFSTYRMDHVFSTEDAKAFWLRNLYAGIRLTVLFGLPANEHCILCNPWRH